MIIWLENPAQWRYLRESTLTRGSRRGFRKGQKLPFGDFYKLVGYELLGCDMYETRGYFIYRIYWLKTYDSGCPQGHEVYDRAGGGQPCEARDVSELLAYSPFCREVE